MSHVVIVVTLYSTRLQPPSPWVSPGLYHVGQYLLFVMDGKKKSLSALSGRYLGLSCSSMTFVLFFSHKI